MEPARRQGLLARRLGRRGERAAARALARLGLRILARNVVTPEGEVDLLALEGRTLVLVEVKTTRCGAALARRVGAVQKRRVRAAGRWLAAKRGFGRRPWRADLVEVRFDGFRPVVTIRRGRIASSRSV